MYAKITALANRMNGNLTGIVGILTTLLLLGAACLAALDLASLSDDGPTNGAFVGNAMFAGALIFGVVIIAPLIGALTLFLLLKRYSQQVGPLFHIEQTAATGLVVGPYAARQLGIADAGLDSLADAVERKRRLEEAALHTDAAPIAQPFDFGPSYADERDAKQSQVSRQDEAVLAQLFANNLTLHEQIELDNDPEKGQEAATEMNQDSLSQLAF